MSNAGVRDAKLCAVENPCITFDSPDINSLLLTRSVTSNMKNCLMHISSVYYRMYSCNEVR